MWRGQNIILELRWEEGKPERYRVLADELVGLNVDIIVAASFAGDPVDQGIVVSLARPGGNRRERTR